MKFNFRSLALVLAFGLSVPSFAAMKLGVVNFARALDSIGKAKKVSESLKKEKETKEKELMKEREELGRMEQDLQKKAAVLSQDAQQKKVEEFQKRAMAFQQKFAKYSEEFERKKLESTQPIIRELRSLVPEIARKQNLDLVLENSGEAVLYAVDYKDLTEELIKLYDSKFK